MIRLRLDACGLNCLLRPYAMWLMIFLARNICELAAVEDETHSRPTQRLAAAEQLEAHFTQGSTDASWSGPLAPCNLCQVREPVQIAHRSEACFTMECARRKAIEVMCSATIMQYEDIGPLGLANLIDAA